MRKEFVTLTLVQSGSPVGQFPTYSISYMTVTRITTAEGYRIS